MVRSRFSNRSRKPVTFLNRGRQIEVLQRHLDLLAADPSHFVVLEIIGLGGTGKTKLLKKIYTGLEEKDAKDVLWVSLERTDSPPETGPLLSIRDQLDFDCFLFDTAIVTYWNAIGQPLQLGQDKGFRDGLVFRLLELGLNESGIPVPLPVSFVLDVYAAGSRQVRKRWRYSKDEFEEIGEFRHSPSELKARLPYYLATDILRRFKQTTRSPVVFYDAYDEQSSTVLDGHSEWLREFIGALESGVHYISTREPLNWAQNDWGDVVSTVVVDKLPEKESRDLIQQRLGVTQRPLEDRIIEASRCIPFFLEATIGTYESLAKDGKTPDLDDLPRTPEEAVSKLLKHLEGSHQKVATTLAAIQVFDQRIYGAIIRDLNLAVDDLDLDSFIDWFFVQQDFPNSYRTHDLLTDFVRSASSQQTHCASALSAATKHLVERCKDTPTSDVSATLRLFRATLEGWESQASMPTESVEALIDAGYGLYDSGYWIELLSFAADVDDDAPDQLKIALRYLEAVSSRRRFGPLAALDRLEQLRTDVDLLGRHRSSYEVEIAYIAELTGDYETARHRFKQLDQQNVPWDPHDRNHRLTRLYNADMLIMDGKLDEGSRLLAQVEQDDGRYDRLYWAELVRHRGHAYRFSFVFDHAETLYARAMRSADAAEGLKGKLHTNLAETYCWTNPEAGLDEAALSIEINERVGNTIEVAKALTAKAVSLANLDRFSEAIETSSVAQRLSAEVGYRAGEAFSLQAQVFTYCRSSRFERGLEAQAKLNALIDDLDTYKHLTVLGSWLLEGFEEFEQSAETIQWISPESLSERLQLVSPKLQ